MNPAILTVGFVFAVTLPLTAAFIPATPLAMRWSRWRVGTDFTSAQTVAGSSILTLWRSLGAIQTRLFSCEWNAVSIPVTSSTTTPTFAENGKSAGQKIRKFALLA